MFRRLHTKLQDGAIRLLVRTQLAARSFQNNEDGAQLVEYGLIVLLIAIFLVAVLVLLGNKLQGVFQSIIGAL